MFSLEVDVETVALLGPSCDQGISKLRGSDLRKDRVGRVEFITVLEVDAREEMVEEPASEYRHSDAGGMHDAVCAGYRAGFDGSYPESAIWFGQTAAEATESRGGIGHEPPRWIGLPRFHHRIRKRFTISVDHHAPDDDCARGSLADDMWPSVPGQSDRQERPDGLRRSARESHGVSIGVEPVPRSTMSKR